MNNCQTILLTMLTIINQVKLYHWQTLNYSRHIATGQLYDELNILVDKFIETLNGRMIIELNNPSFRIILNNVDNINLKNYNDENAHLLLKNIKEYFESSELNIIIQKSSDLENIRDEMLAIVNKTIYLFSLK